MKEKNKRLDFFSKIILHHTLFHEHWRLSYKSDQNEKLLPVIFQILHYNGYQEEAWKVLERLPAKETWSADSLIDWYRETWCY